MANEFSYYLNRKNTEMMDRTKTSDVAELTKLGLKTFLNIGQMARYRGIGALGLLAFGIAGLISRE